MSILACCLFGLLAMPAQADDALSESLVVARFADRSIAALATHRAEHAPFRRAILLFPGSPGIMRLSAVDSYGMKGNFLIRSRRHWLDAETVVFSVDAPSDEWHRFFGAFRASARYAEDIAGLWREIRAAYGPLPLTLVGTSEGSVSAFHAARALAAEAPKLILSSSLFNSSRNSPGLSTFDFSELKTPLLWVHHAEDSCAFTPYGEAKAHAEKTRAPLITVRVVRPGRGSPCEAFSQHGFIGVEAETVRAMKRWVVDGIAADVTD